MYDQKQESEKTALTSHRVMAYIARGRDIKIYEGK